MLLSYIRLALRHLAQHRLYAVINITGLALGLTIYLFGSLLVAYEYDHDHMFSQRQHIFTVGSILPLQPAGTLRNFPMSGWHTGRYSML